MVHLGQVLTLLCDSDVARKLKSVRSLRTKIGYPGHVISYSRLEIAKTTIEVFKELKDPTNGTERWSSPGLCNVFHCFVLNFSSIAAPVIKKLCKDELTQFQTFSVKEKNALEQLKLLLKTSHYLLFHKQTAI